MVNFDFAFGQVFYWDCRVVAVAIWFPYEPRNIINNASIYVILESVVKRIL